MSQDYPTLCHKLRMDYARFLLEGLQILCQISTTLLQNLDPTIIWEVIMS